MKWGSRDGRKPEGVKKPYQTNGGSGKKRKREVSDITRGDEESKGKRRKGPTRKGGGKS